MKLCRNFVERHCFLVSKFCGKALFPGVEILWKGSLRDSPETMQKLHLSTKFWHQKIKWNYGIFRSPRQSRIVYWWHILQTTFVEMALIPFYHLRWVFFIWVSKSQWIKILIKTGFETFQRQPHKMVKHTQTIRRLFPMKCLSVFDHFVGLALKGLNNSYLILSCLWKWAFIFFGIRVYKEGKKQLSHYFLWWSSLNIIYCKLIN